MMVLLPLAIILSREAAQSSWNAFASCSEVSRPDSRSMIYRQSHLVLMLAQQENKPHYTMQQVALKMMHRQIRGLPDYDSYIHPDIRRLREADRAGNSNYVGTLFQYLLCGGNTTDTANSLGLHRNSLIYRINRIRDIIESDLDKALHRKLLLMSFLFESDAE